MILYTKGADSIIIPRLSPAFNIHKEVTIDYIDGFAKEGLRTLMLCKRVIQEREYD